MRIITTLGAAAAALAAAAAAAPAAAQEGHSLALSGPGTAKTGDPIVLTATGVVPEDVFLNRYVNVYAIPASVLATCPETLQSGMQVSYDTASKGGDTVANTVPAEGAFSIPIAYTPSETARGQMLLCGYLHEGVETMATAAHVVRVTRGAAKPVALKAPKVTRRGGHLVCSKGRWSGRPTSYAYHWRKDGKRIRRETGNRLRLTAGLRGSTVTCGVRARNAKGAATAMSSNGMTVG